MGFNSYQQYRRDDKTDRASTIRELQTVATQIDDLAAEYAKCKTAMEEMSFLSAANLQKSCTDPLGTRLTSLRRQIESSAAVLDVGTWQEMTALVELAAQDYRFAAFAVQMTRDFENQITRDLPFLCPAKRAALSFKLTQLGDREAARAATKAQLYFYFLLRDFIPPTIDGVKARVLLHVRSAQLARLPRDLIESANALLQTQKQRNQFQLREWNNPFGVFAFKFMTPRDIATASPNEKDESTRWNAISLQAINRAVGDRPEGMTALIACGALKQGFRPVTTRTPEE
jgi:hypothetical protein